MAAAVTLRSPGVSSEGKYFVAEFDVAFSGSYTTGGDTANFTAPGMASLGTPFVTLQPTTVAGWTLTYLPNTTMANGTIMIFNDALAQHSAAAVNAAVTAVAFRATVRIGKYKR